MTIRRQLLNFSIGILALTLLGTTGLICLFQWHSSVEELDRDLHVAAVMAKNVYPPKYHARFVGTNSEEFRGVSAQLSQECKELGLSTLWSAARIHNNIVITSTSASTQNAVQGVLPADVMAACIKALETAQPQTLEIHSQNARMFLFPYVDDVPCVIAATKSTTETSQRLESTVAMMIGMSVLVLLAGSWIAVILAKRMASSINAISEKANELTKENDAKPGQKFQISGSFELEELCRNLNHLCHEMQRKLDKVAEDKEELQTTLNSIGDALITGDAKGCVVWMNPMAEKLTGWTLAEAIKRPVCEVFNILNSETRKPVASFSDLTTANKTATIEPVRFPFLLLTRDGHEHPITHSVAPIHDKDQHAVGIVLVFRDVTCEYKRELTLRESEADLRRAQTVAHLGNWSWDIVKRISTWSDEMYQIFGVRKDDFVLTKENIIERIHPEDRQRYEMLGRSAVQGANAGPFEGRIIRPDGEIRMVAASGFEIVCDSDGKRVRLFGTIWDITDQKLALESLRQSERRLKEAQALGGIGDWELNPETGWVSFSDQMNRLLERDPAKGPIHCSEAVEYVHPEDAQAVLDHVTTAFKNNKSSEFTLRIRLPSGRVAWHQGIANVVKNAEGKMQRVYGVNLDVTERRKNELALKESQQKYRLLVENAHEAIYVVQNRKIQYANSMASQIAGMSEEDLFEKDLQVFLPSEDWDSALKHHERLMNGELTQSQREYHILTRPGKPEWLLVNSVFILWKGQPATLNFAPDITAHKKAEADLEASERNYREIFNSTYEAIFLHDAATGNILDVNEAMCRLFGYSSKEEVLKLNLEVLTPRGDSIHTLQEALHRIQRAVTEDSQVFEWLARKKNGEDFWVEVSLRCSEIGGQGRILAVVRDISDRKRAEAALLESEKRYRLIANNVADVIWVLDAETQRFTYVSPSVIKTRGFTTEEIINSPLESALSKESLKRMSILMTDRVAKSQPGTSFIDEVEQPCKDGSFVQTEITTTFLLNEKGKLEIIGISRDISERKHAEAERAQLQEQLTQVHKMESIGRLAGGVAHDFNNMLQAILGNVALSLLDLPANSPLRENLEEIEKCAQRSADLTRQLLAFARKQTVVPQELDLNKTVAGMIKMLRRLITEDIELVWTPGQGPLPIKIDPSQLDQILANLCVNARDAIGNMGKITIETSKVTFDNTTIKAHPGMPFGNYVLLSISDTGCGMDKQVIEHLFEPFYTTKNIGQGTGLGLATVYGIVNQNKGAISVQSVPGKGSVFKIFFPWFNPKNAKKKKEIINISACGGFETILLVEDEPVILMLGKRALESLGYTVLIANTPSQAIQIAGEHIGKIQLLITDVVMPEMNGRDLAQALSERDATINKCLFMSGYTADVIASHGILDENIHFIQKPFTVENLAQKVREALDSDKSKDFGLPQ